MTSDNRSLIAVCADSSELICEGQVLKCPCIRPTRSLQGAGIFGRYNDGLVRWLGGRCFCA